MESPDKLCSDVEEFAIVFDNDPAVYREGDSVAGTIIIHNSVDVRYREVYVEVCGIALVKWTTPLPDDETNGDIIDPEEVKGDCNKEQYFQKKITLIAKDGGFFERDPVLEQGHHMYRFDVKLPPELPSSFEGQYGQVRYLARAVIERNIRSNVITKQAFTVISGLDLNFIPEAAAKMELCKQKSLGNCCTAGSVTADWTVERSGFVPGEDIIIHGAVQNDSKDNVTMSRVTLFMVIEYKARRRRRREKREVVKVEKGETSPDDVTLWQDSLHIPPLPPTGLSRCRLIDITYELQFLARLDSGHTPIEFTKEVFIGTVPMCRSEMRSCIAGMFNQPYAKSVEDIFSGSRASQLSLTQIVCVGSARSASNPTAPALSIGKDLDQLCGEKPLTENSRLLRDEVISGVGLSPTKKESMVVYNEESPTASLLMDRPPSYAPMDRPPSYAPGHDDDHRPPPTAPGTLTLQKPWTGPTFESSLFGSVSLRDGADDEESIRGELTYNPMYTYYGTVGKAPD